MDLPRPRALPSVPAMRIYDRIGATYTATRQPDPRIGAQIAAALDDCRSVINVGAGAGAYEPPQTVLAADPSPVMISQRPAGSAPAVQACAEVPTDRPQISGSRQRARRVTCGFLPRLPVRNS